MWGLRFSGRLCSVRWWFVTDAAGQDIGPVFKGWSFTAWPLKVGQACHPKTSVTNYQPPPVNITEEQRSWVHCGGNLKCCKLLIWFFMWSPCCPSGWLYRYTSCATTSFFMRLHMQLKAVGYIKETAIEVGKTRYRWENVHILHLLFKRLCFGDKWFLCSCFLVDQPRGLVVRASRY